MVSAYHCAKLIHYGKRMPLMFGPIVLVVPNKFVIRCYRRCAGILTGYRFFFAVIRLKWNNNWTKWNSVALDWMPYNEFITPAIGIQWLHLSTIIAFALWFFMSLCLRMCLCVCLYITNKAHACSDTVKKCNVQIFYARVCVPLILTYQVHQFSANNSTHLG